VLAALPDGAEVHSALSETIRELGITREIDESGRYDSVRVRLGAMDRETQGREMRKLGAYGYAAGKVILVVGHQKLVTDMEEARRRLVEYSLPREFARMQSLGRPGRGRQPSTRRSTTDVSTWRSGMLQ
jgi:hypothetical protein